MKKAMELSILCGSNIQVVMIDEVRKSVIHKVASFDEGTDLKDYKY